MARKRKNEPAPLPVYLCGFPHPDKVSSEVINGINVITVHYPLPDEGESHGTTRQKP